MNKKVLIVGGGPAGTSAGICLQQNGFNVSLFEQGDENRSKTCGEGLTPESQNILKKLNMMKKVQNIAYFTNELTLFDLFNKPISIYNKYYTLKRTVFDKLLRQEIINSGGKVSYNTTITNIKVSTDKVIIEDQNKKQYKGDIVILATGAETLLAKKLGFTSINNYTAISMREYAYNTMYCKTLEFYFHRKLFPAYGWVFPLPDNILNIGVYTHKDTGPTRDLSQLMKIFYEVLAERFHKPLQIIDQPRGWILNTGLMTNSLCANRVILCGENIASTYNFSGEGIGTALKSGFLAAQTILEAKGSYTKTSLSSYEHRIRSDLGPMHNWYNRLTKLFKSKIIFFIACLLLRYSKRVKQLTQNIIDEKISFQKGFSPRYLFRFLFK